MDSVAIIPLIRFKAIEAKESHLFNQAYGLLTSLEASMIESFPAIGAFNPDLSISLDLFRKRAELVGKGVMHFSDEVENKRAKFNRTSLKLLQVANVRSRKRLLSNFTKTQLERAGAVQKQLFSNKES